VANHEVLTSKKRAAIRALVCGASYSKAAAAAGVHENTVSQWMKDPIFCDALHQAEAEAMAGITRTLLQLAGGAGKVLDQVLKNSLARDSSKIRAADVVLGRLLQIKEMTELEDRIKRIEDLLSNRSEK